MWARCSVESDRERLAWAAGFFDGEGSTAMSGFGYPVLRVGQSTYTDDLEPDDRLLKLRAIFGFGVLSGPRLVEGRKPHFTLTVNGVARVQMCIAAMWPFLSDVKRKQAIKALSGRRPGSGRTHVEWERESQNPEMCVRGHFRTDVTTYVRSNGDQQCRVCDAADHRAKRKAELEARRGRGEIPAPKGAKGQDNGCATLTNDDVRSIRNLWATGQYRQRELGERFGVRQTTISKIVRCESWTHLCEESSTTQGAA